MSKVAWGKSVEKQLDRIPEMIVRKFRIWVALVEESGIRDVRKCPGFHDEPLKGNRAYRAIYIEHEDQELELIEVIEVNKREY